MIYLLLILIVTAVSLTVLLWAGTFFFQGYIYTEPSPGIFWQAPAAAALLTFGYTIWCLSIALSSQATPQNIPIATINRFNPYDEMPELKGRPAEKIWAIKERKKSGEDKGEEKIPYVSQREERGGGFVYKDTSSKPGPWQRQGVTALEIEKPDQTTMRFQLTETEVGGYRRFLSKEGWVITEYEKGPTGQPEHFSFLKLLLNLIFNFGHLVGWFLALWLLLRFQWTHALGLALVLWLIFTLTILPMLLGYSGYVAANRRALTVTTWNVRPAEPGA